MDIYMEEYNETQQQPVKNPKPQKKWKKKVGYALLAVTFAGVFFFAGLFAHWLMLDPEMRTLIRVKGRIQDEYYEEITDDKFYDTVFDAINNNILDDYSAYLTPKEYFAESMADNGYNQGVGLYSQTRTVDGKAESFVLMAFGNSPAERAGIREGDSIIAYGDDESSLSADADGEKLTEFLLGKSLNEKFCFKVRKENGEIKLITLAREEFVEDFVSYRDNKTSYTYYGVGLDDATETNFPLTCLDDDTAYIRLTSFMGYAQYEFIGAMVRFAEEGKKNLVLDLRFNTGGALDILSDIASVFCKNATEQSPVVAVADYGAHKEKDYFRCTRNRYYDYFTDDSKIFVLADNLSASASECLLGVMLDYGAIDEENICLSYRDGEAKTYGKGIMQETKPVRWFLGGALRLTTAHVLWPVSERCIHGVGITPSDGAKTVEELYGDREITQAIGKLLA